MAKKDEKAPPKEAHEPEESEHEEEEGEESDEEESDEDRDDDEEDGDEEDDEEDEDGDEEDEDDDEEGEEEHHARGIVSPVMSARLHDEHDPHAGDPTWWLPHVVLGGVVLIGVLGFFGAFSSLLGPPLQRLNASLFPVASASAPASSNSAPAQAAKAPPAMPVRPTQPQVPPQPAPAQAEMLGAKHLVVMYKGSERAPGNITRSKDEAQKRAAEALKLLKAKDGKNWDEIVVKYSDEPGADHSKGDLGRFSPQNMTPLFTTAVKKLKVGDMSDVVETPFGFHVLVRTF